MPSAEHGVGGGDPDYFDDREVIEGVDVNLFPESMEDFMIPEESPDPNWMNP